MGKSSSAVGNKGGPSSSLIESINGSHKAIEDMLKQGQRMDSTGNPPSECCKSRRFFFIIKKL